MNTIEKTHDELVETIIRLQDEIAQLRGHKEEADRHIKTIAELRAEIDQLKGILKDQFGVGGRTEMGG